MTRASAIYDASVNYTDWCDVEVQVIVRIRDRKTGRVLGKSCSIRGCGKGYLSEEGRHRVASAGFSGAADKMEKLDLGWRKDAQDRADERVAERVKEIRRRMGYDK